MQHAQLNFAKRALAVTLVIAAFPALAGTIPKPSKSDSLLDGGAANACASGTDYAAGLDTNGQAVVPADVEAAPMPVPDAIAIPLAGNNGRRGPGSAPPGNSAYISLHGAALAPLINPPACRLRKKR